MGSSTFIFQAVMNQPSIFILCLKQVQRTKRFPFMNNDAFKLYWGDVHT